MNKNTLGIPIAIIVANYFVMGFLFPQGDVWNAIYNAIYNVIRIAAIGYAGWLVVQRGGGKLRVAAFAGLLLFAIDHIVLRGGGFLFDAYALNQDPQRNLSAFGGVLISYAMFAPIDAAVAVVGGLASRWATKRQ